MKKVAYIGNFGFPDKNASGKRVLGNCKLLQSIGYKVICIGPGTQNPEYYEGVKLYSIHTGNEIERVIRNNLRAVENIINNEQVGIVFIYGALFTQKENIQLIKWCQKRNIRAYYDQVDWLDLNWHNPLRGMIRARNYFLLNKKVIPDSDGVVCISSYLADIHSKAGRRTVIIPPLAIEKSTGFSETFHTEQCIHFVYAGTTSDVNRPISQWKDRIDIMFEKLKECSKDPCLQPFQLDIYGMTEEQYIKMFPLGEQDAGREVIKELGHRVSFHGTVPNQEVMEELRQADFTILIRDKKRATMSGFPTKVSESITCGTPVLCNDTSDIKRYVVDGETGFVMDDVRELFTRTLKAQRNEIIHMKNACKNNPFYYSNFSAAMTEFLKG